MYTKEEIEKAFLKWYTMPDEEYVIDKNLLEKPMEERIRDSKEVADWIINAIEDERLNLPVVN